MAYSDLSTEAQGIIEEVKARFGNLYDSINGGPHLADESPSFDDDTYALLLKAAVQRVNSKGVVTKSFTLMGFPYIEPIGEGAITLALVVEVIKHFILTYTEVTSATGMDGPYLSRGDYMDRWEKTRTMFESDLDDAVAALDKAIITAGSGSGSALLIWTNQMPWGTSARVRPLRPPWMG